MTKAYKYLTESLNTEVEVKRLQEAIKDLNKRFRKEGDYLFRTGNKERAKVKRASMDLTRQLVLLRKSL